jgi:hypothetical protein
LVITGERDDEVGQGFWHVPSVELPSQSVHGLPTCAVGKLAGRNWREGGSPSGSVKNVCWPCAWAKWTTPHLSMQGRTP